MKIKNFEQLNESHSDKYEKMAIKAGYNVGDFVYNINAGRYMTIIPSEDYKNVGDKYCTIGAVGESPEVYRKVDDDDYSNNSEVRKRRYKKDKLKDSINLAVLDYTITKDELIKYINSL